MTDIIGNGLVNGTSTQDYDKQNTALDLNVSSHNDERTEPNSRAIQGEETDHSVLSSGKDINSVPESQTIQGEAGSEIPSDTGNNENLSKSGDDNIRGTDEGHTNISNTHNTNGDSPSTDKHSVPTDTQDTRESVQQESNSQDEGNENLPVMKDENGESVSDQAVSETGTTDNHSKETEQLVKHIVSDENPKDTDEVSETTDNADKLTFDDKGQEDKQQKQEDEQEDYSESFEEPSKSERSEENSFPTYDSEKADREQKSAEKIVDENRGDNNETNVKLSSQEDTVLEPEFTSSPRAPVVGSMETGHPPSETSQKPIDIPRKTEVADERPSSRLSENANQDNSERTVTEGSWPSYDSKQEDMSLNEGDKHKITNGEDKKASMTQSETDRQNEESIMTNKENNVNGEHPNEKHEKPVPDIKNADDESTLNSDLKSEDKKEEVTPRVGDDTLDDIEALTTISEPNPVITEENHQNYEEEEPVEKLNHTKPDLEKSETADDNARADDIPKDEIGNDTDHETEELASEEVHRKDKADDKAEDSLQQSHNREQINETNTQPQLENQQEKEPTEKNDETPDFESAANRTEDENTNVTDERSMEEGETVDNNSSSGQQHEYQEQTGEPHETIPNQNTDRSEYSEADPSRKDDSHYPDDGLTNNEPFSNYDNEDFYDTPRENDALGHSKENNDEKHENETNEHTGQDTDRTDQSVTGTEQTIDGRQSHEGENSPQLIDKAQIQDEGQTEQQRPETEPETEQQPSETEPEQEPEPEPDPEPEPEPVKITRNIEIDNAVETVNAVEESVQDLLTDMKELMNNYHEKLKSQPLVDFVQDLDKFRGDFKSMHDAYKKCDNMFINLNKALKELRVSGDEFNTLMDKKFRDEELSTWTVEEEDEEKQKMKEERIAATKTAIAKATDARAYVAKAAIAVAESTVFAGECEADAADAAATAAKALELAQVARKDAENAVKAAEEKRQAEEIARQRAEERARKKAAEEKKKQEEEDKQIAEEAKRKGTSFVDEKRKALNEKARKEAERRNPKNWPRMVFSVDRGDFDPGVGCIIRAIDGCLKHNDVEVRRLDQMSGILTLVENEELIGNIIEITPKDPEKKHNFEEPLAIAFPHCLPRAVPGREPVVKTLASNGNWVELPTKDVLFDDIREIRFVETHTRQFGVFAVVLRLKRDTLTFIRKGNKINTAVDARVSFTCQHGTFKGNTNFTVEIQQIDQTVLTDLKSRRPNECTNLMACSPIIKFSIQKTFNKPVIMTLPLPPNPTRQKRPTTAVVSITKEDKSEPRPVSARPLVSFNANKEEEVEEELHLIVREEHGIWTKLPDVTILQAKNKDIVTVEIKEPHDRFLVLRTGLGMSPMKLETASTLLETAVTHRSINVFLRQLNSNLNKVIVGCCSVSKTEKELKKAAAEGYEEGPPPSRQLIVKEGQIMEIAFRGNIHCTTEDVLLKFIYNKYIKSKVRFEVQETDIFAQKGFNCYRGFTQIFTKMMVPKPVPPSDKPKQKQTVTEMVEEERLTAELLISIPKPEPEPPKPLRTAPINITNEGPDTQDVLMYLAGELGDEWRKLAQYLNLKSVRIQAILRQNYTNSDPKKIRYDMLVTWAKRIPRCVNKLDILSHALLASGRGDLAEELRERDSEFRRRRSAALKDTYLNRAFVKVAQNPTAVKEWKIIAKRLGVSEMDVTEIERTKPSIQEKCYYSLRKWQTTAGEEASLPVLGAKLRMCNYRGLARDIEAIG